MTAAIGGVHASFLTGASPAAIGIIHLHGPPPSLDALLRALTAQRDWFVGRVQFVRLADLDDLIITRAAADVAQLMPHGGPRIRQRLAGRLEELGVTIDPPNEIDPRQAFPEARDDIEALMLRALAVATSPRAIDLLLAQPDRWRACTAWTDADEARSKRLNHLLTSPRVVLVGPANVGKSTLTNALAGRAASIAADQPGTTRDYTLTRLDLAGLVVDWFDTPGIRDTDDELERAAQRLARRLLAQADLLIAMTDHQQPWPTLPREPDLRIANKSDVARRDDDDIDAHVAAATGTGLAELVAVINAALIPPDDLASTRPWRFSSDIALPA